MNASSKSPDYPAAHSMDTTWFAVDRDGAVGVFTSGEPGLVPASAREYDDEIETVAEALPARGDMILDYAFAKPPGSRPDAFPRRRKAPLPYRGDRVFFVARDSAIVERAFANLSGFARSKIDGLDVVLLEASLSGNSDPRLAAWSDAFADLRKCADPISEHGLDARELVWARAGFYVYEVTERLYNADPYGRKLVPTVPLRVAELGASVAARLSSTARFGVSFAEARYVQPAEHFACVGWGTSIYLASDGVTVRPLPGHDADYEAQASTCDESDQFEPLVFDPKIEG